MSNDPLSQEIGSGVNTRGSDEERIEHQELTDNILPTPNDSPLSGGYLTWRKKKDAQAVEILKLKNKIKKLERKAKSSIPPPKRRLYKQVDSSDNSLGKENASKQGRNVSNKIEEFNLSDKGSGGIKVFDDTTAAEKDVNAVEPVFTAGDAVTAASVIQDIDTAGPSNVSAAGPFTSIARDIFEDEMMTIADTLVVIRSTRPRTTSVVIRDVEEEPRRETPVLTVQSQDKGKSKIVKPEPTPKNPIKAQIQKDAEIAQRLFEEDQAQFEREQRIAREIAIEQEAKDAALIAEFDNVQAARLQEEEREQFFIDEQARFLVETITERKRYTHNQLKNKSLEEIQKLYEREQKWINDFVPMDSEEGGKKAESSKKEAASSKKRQKADPDDENVKIHKIGEASGSGEEKSAEKEKELSEEELHKLLVIVPMEELVIQPLQKFDRDDLVKLWDLVKERFNTTEPADDKEKELWVKLKRLFELDNDDIL
ncbi:hypothetical protein Tco_1426662 [Tanacetum coccineum]